MIFPIMQPALVFGAVNEADTEKRSNQKSSIPMPINRQFKILVS